MIRTTLQTSLFDAPPAPAPTDSAASAGQHRVDRGRRAEGASEMVETLYRAGLYAIHRNPGPVVVLPFVVTHTPTGLSVGRFVHFQNAEAMAHHMHKALGTAGAGVAFGEHPDDDAMPAFREAHATFWRTHDPKQLGGL